MRLALKVDVDTYRGLAEGAPRIAAFLQSKKIPASFFVTMGPDRSGTAVKRFWSQKGFAQKMGRTHAPSLYGWRTVLSGTLLPARPMAASFAETLRAWSDEGFEVGPHGYDHIRWHDEAAHWTEPEARIEIERCFDLYRFIFGKDPSSFAAPGWQAGAGTWAALEATDILYHSDTRGFAPYFSTIHERVLQKLEIPTTLPTWDEMLGEECLTPESLAIQTWSHLRAETLNVWTLHAEVEGEAYFSQFKEFIMRCSAEGIQWIFLPALARELLAERRSVPRSSVEQGHRPGRAGAVTCQIQESTASRSQCADDGKEFLSADNVLRSVN